MDRNSASMSMHGMARTNQNNYWVSFSVGHRTQFEIDGDLKDDKVLEVSGSREHVWDWMREKLRKMENGQIKIFKWYPQKERDWEREEAMKKCLRENIQCTRVDGFLKSIYFQDAPICSVPVHENHQIEQRPPSPTCKIS